MTKPWLHTLATLILFGAGLLTYLHSFSNGFVLDDELQIVTNAVVQSPQNIKAFFLGSTINNGTSSLSGVYYKPIMTTLYSLLWWWEPGDAFWFHLFQWTIGFFNALLAYRLFLRFFEPWLALAGAMIFFIHPINSEVIVYIADLQDVLFTFFGLLALDRLSRTLCVSWGQAFMVGGLLLLSLLSKESGALYVMILPLFAVIFRLRGALKIGLSCGVSVCVYLWLRVGVAQLTKLVDTMNQIGRASWGTRLLTAPQAMVSYIWKFFYPVSFSTTQDWVIESPTWNSFWLPLLGLAAILALSLVFARRQWQNSGSKDFLFFMIWTVLGFGFHSHIIAPLDGTVADRWFYFTSLGGLGMLGVVVRHWKVPARHGCILTAMIVLTLSVRSRSRSLDWEDNFTICSHDLKVSPNSYDLHNNLGVELFRRGQIKEAQAEFIRSTELAPYWDINWNNLGAAYSRLGDLTRAEEYYLRSINNGRYFIAYENYASLLITQGRLNEAKQFLDEKALPTFPGSQRLLELRTRL